MPELLPKTKLAHYSVISKISAGGMGEVYLADDTELQRKVALKLLFPELNQNENYLRRFKQEAQAASALNHPNIVTVYQIGGWEGRQFIAMEFVEGSNLRHLINKREIDLNDALDIAVQTASALTAAHAAGIVHRDIKPENIVRRPDGLVKVLDFGLAKRVIMLPQQGVVVNTEAATWEQVNTMPGLLMGTAAYMSPEQARGKETDERTDIWSLGVVIYEMITGHSPFAGETKSDMLASILKTDPPSLSFYAPEVPPELERIIKKCLGKNFEDRYQSIKDLLLDLKLFRGEMLSGSGEIKREKTFPTENVAPKQTQPEDPVETLNGSRSYRWLWFAVPAVLLLAVLSVWYLRYKPAVAETNLASLASVQVTSWKSDLGEDSSNRAQFSPDGKLIAFVAAKNGKSAIWLKQLGGGEPFTRKTDDAEEKNPVWSPDGASIAYLSDRGGRRGIWMMPALGGSPTLLAPLDGWGQLIHWSKDGANLYFEMRQNIYALAVASKQISKLTSFDETQILRHDFNFSPDEKRIVYVDRKDGQKDLWIADVSGENAQRLNNDVFDDGNPVWHSDGQRIIYNSNRNGIRQICLAFANGQQPVQLTFSDSDSSISDIAPDGRRILYQSAKDDSDIWSVSAEGGKEFQLTSDIGAEFWQDISSNGEMVIYQASQRPSIGDKMLNSLIAARKIGSAADGENGQMQVATDGFSPRWSPDARQATFLRLTDRKINIWLTSATGGDARQLTTDGIFFGGFSLLPFNRLQTQDYQWSPDSRSIIFSADRDGVSNIRQAAVDGSGEKQLTANEDKNLHFSSPMFSPDGKRIVWLAWTLNNNQRIWSIWSLSIDGGKPVQIFQSGSVLRLIGWSASGNELIVGSIENGSDTQTLPVDAVIFQIPATGGGGSTLISKLKEIYFQNAVLSPDRKTIAFASRQNGSGAIQVLPVSGGAAKTIVESNDPRVYFSSLSFAPDGKTIYYGKQANWQIISMIDNFK